MRYEKDGLSGIGDEYGNGNNGICGGAKPIVLVNRQEFFLQDTAMQKDGKWLIFCGGLGRK